MNMLKSIFKQKKKGREKIKGGKLLIPDEDKDTDINLGKLNILATIKQNPIWEEKTETNAPPISPKDTGKLSNTAYAVFKIRKELKHKLMLKFADINKVNEILNIPFFQTWDKFNNEHIGEFENYNFKNF